MMRRSILTDHGIQFRPEYFVCEDYALWVDMIPYTQMRNLDATLLYVRAHDKQITAQSWRDASQLRLRRAILGEIHKSALMALNLVLSEEDMEIYNLAVGAPAIHTFHFAISRGKPSYSLLFLRA